MAAAARPSGGLYASAPMAVVRGEVDVYAHAGGHTCSLCSITYALRLFPNAYREHSARAVANFHT